MSVPSKPVVRTLRPSLVVAEALVDRQGPSQIVAQARRNGFSSGLTNVVVAACCRTATDSRFINANTTTQDRSAPKVAQT